MTTTSDKQKLIQEMIRMQKQFMQRERDAGLDARDYYAPAEDGELHGYAKTHDELAAQVVDLAHAERGSKR